MKIEKAGKLLTKLYNENKYVMHIKNLTQTLNQGLVLKKVHRIFKFSQETWLKPHIDMKTELSKNAKYDFQYHFFCFVLLKLINNEVFGKTMKNVSNHKVIKVFKVVN